MTWKHHVTTYTFLCYLEYDTCITAYYRVQYLDFVWEPIHFLCTTTNNKCNILEWNKKTGILLELQIMFISQNNELITYISLHCCLLLSYCSDMSGYHWFFIYVYIGRVSFTAFPNGFISQKKLSSFSSI